MAFYSTQSLFKTNLVSPMQRLKESLTPWFWPLLIFWLSACGGFERDNPYDPASGQPRDDTALSLYLPLPKPLARVVNRIEAILEGPGMRTISTELTYTALGPANGTIGAIPPGTDRILTIRGYDLDGALLFSGQQRGITISVGDTTQIRLTLDLIGEIPDNGGTEDNTEPPIADTEPPTADTEPPTADTEPPTSDNDGTEDNTEPPATDTEPPATDTEPPATDTELPTADTEPPTADTEHHQLQIIQAVTRPTEKAVGPPIPEAILLRQETKQRPPQIAQQNRLAQNLKQVRKNPPLLHKDAVP
jgi:hypothetical protein